MNTDDITDDAITTEKIKQLIITNDTTEISDEWAQKLLSLSTAQTALKSERSVMFKAINGDECVFLPLVLVQDNNVQNELELFFFGVLGIAGMTMPEYMTNIAYMVVVSKTNKWKILDITADAKSLTEVLNQSSGDIIGSVLKDGSVSKSKLSTDVQTSLGKADTALQSIADGSITSEKMVLGARNAIVIDYNVNGPGIPVEGWDVLLNINSKKLNTSDAVLLVNIGNSTWYLTISNVVLVADILVVYAFGIINNVFCKVGFSVTRDYPNDDISRYTVSNYQSTQMGIAESNVSSTSTNPVQSKAIASYVSDSIANALKKPPYLRCTANTTLSISDPREIICNSNTSQSLTITLPSSPVDGMEYHIVNTSYNAQVVTVKPYSGSIITGWSTTGVPAQLSSIQIATSTSSIGSITIKYVNIRNLASSSTTAGVWILIDNR